MCKYEWLFGWGVKYAGPYSYCVSILQGHAVKNKMKCECNYILWFMVWKGGQDMNICMNHYLVPVWVRGSGISYWDASSWIIKSGMDSEIYALFMLIVHEMNVFEK